MSITKSIYLEDSFWKVTQIITLSVCCLCFSYCSSTDDQSFVSLESSLYDGDYVCTKGAHIFKPETFLQNTPEPLSELRTFSVPWRSKICVNLFNDSLSSPCIEVDGLEVFCPLSFDSNITEISRTLVLDEGIHELSVILPSGSQEESQMMNRPVTVEIRIGVASIVDTKIKPSLDYYPGIDGVGERPLGAVAVSGGKAVTFVENEIILLTDDVSIIHDILSKYDGEILLQLDSTKYGFDVPLTNLIRIDVDKGDVNKLPNDLSLITENYGMVPMGELQFSSFSAMKLISIVAAETVSGNLVGTNMIIDSLPSSIPDSTQEAHECMGDAIPLFRSDAYHWEEFLRNDTFGRPLTGVAEAWSLLYYANKLNYDNEHRFKIAIFDYGFYQTPDIPYYTYTSLVAGIGDPTGHGDKWWMPDPNWHGGHMAGIATARPDNGYGVAGVAGPVTYPHYVYAFKDAISYTAALYAAGANTNIINCSFSGRFHYLLFLLGEAMRPVFNDVGDSNLIFAAAGNDDKNVDKKVCVPLIGWPCWEKEIFWPCEYGGTKCVGSLTNVFKSVLSNWGNSDVKIWAPALCHLGKDPSWSNIDSCQNNYNVNYTKDCGTSGATAFMSGSAALIWAADPSLSPDEVWDTIVDTAYIPEDRQFNERNVNVYKAVCSLIGMYFVVEITSPEDGAILHANRNYGFDASVITIAEQGAPIDANAMWRTSDGDILFTEDISLPRDYSSCQHDSWRASRAVLALSEGTYDITASVQGWEASGSDTITVFVEDSPPHHVVIYQPNNGSQLCEGEPILFHGDGDDHNETISDEMLIWNSYNDGTIGVGRYFTSDQLSVGEHNISLYAIDSNFQVTYSMPKTITVLSSADQECSVVGDSPPTAYIILPENGAGYFYDYSDEIGYYAYVDLQAYIYDEEDFNHELDISWESDVEGFLYDWHTTTIILHAAFSCYGTDHIITLRVEDTAGNVSEDHVTVTIETPPCR